MATFKLTLSFRNLIVVVLFLEAAVPSSRSLETWDISNRERSKLNFWQRGTQRDNWSLVVNFLSIILSGHLSSFNDSTCRCLTTHQRQYPCFCLWSSTSEPSRHDSSWEVDLEGWLVDLIISRGSHQFSLRPRWEWKKSNYLRLTCFLDDSTRPYINCLSILEG